MEHDIFLKQKILFFFLYFSKGKNVVWLANMFKLKFHTNPIKTAGWCQSAVGDTADRQVDYYTHIQAL